jgi:hypothetical protein
MGKVVGCRGWEGKLEDARAAAAKATESCGQGRSQVQLGNEESWGL